MFNFCEYVCISKILILGNDESSIATMSHTNILRRSEMQMFFLNNRIELNASNKKFLLRLTSKVQLSLWLR